MTVEELQIELKALISNLTSSGFKSVEPAVVDKINELIIAAGELRMNEGKRLVENLLNVIKAIREGKSQAESGYIRLTALDFYVKNLSDSSVIEDI